MNKQRVESSSGERGQVLVLMAVALVGLLGFAALAIDGGMIYADRRQAQNAADAASLAAALAIVNPPQNWRQAALNRAQSNGYPNNGTTKKVEVYDPPISGPYAGNTEYVQVFVESQVDTSLVHLVFPGPIVNKVEAVAHAKPGHTGPMYYGDAMVSLSPQGCALFWTHGNSNGTVDGGGIFVNSDSGCAFRQSGGSGELTAPGITVVGGTDIQKPDTINAPVQTGADQEPYPPEFEVPTPTHECDTPASVHANVMSPGQFDGTFPPNQVDTLQEGVYCVNGDFVVNSNTVLTGHNVLIYVQNGHGVTFNGGATIHLDAMDTGPYKGMLIYVDPQNYTVIPPSNATTVKIDGNNESTFTGTIYAPASNVVINGTGAPSGLNSQVVGYSIELSGTNDTYIHYDSDENAEVIYPPLLNLAQ